MMIFFHSPNYNVLVKEPPTVTLVISICSRGYVLVCLWISWNSMWNFLWKYAFFWERIIMAFTFSTGFMLQNYLGTPNLDKQLMSYFPSGLPSLLKAGASLEFSVLSSPFLRMAGTGFLQRYKKTSTTTTAQRGPHFLHRGPSREDSYWHKNGVCNGTGIHTETLLRFTSTIKIRAVTPSWIKTGILLSNNT